MSYGRLFRLASFTLATLLCCGNLVAQDILSGSSSQSDVVDAENLDGENQVRGLGNTSRIESYDDSGDSNLNSNSDLFGIRPQISGVVNENLDRALDYDTTQGGGSQAESTECGCEEWTALNKSISSAHKGLFYNNNFDYLCDPCLDCWMLGDGLKRMSVTDRLTIDVGGQFRMRYHNENNIRGLGLTGVDDSFLLFRTRLYANLEYGDSIRAYVEGFDAVSNYEQFGPRPIEEDRSDLLNAFIDVKLYSGCCGDLWGRVGRQELLYGAQRTVSPLDWANTRRTFDGAKLFWRGENWDLDAFWTNPVPNNRTHFNDRDSSQEFMGLYSTYKGGCNGKWDFYYLRYTEWDAATNFEFNTFGIAGSGNRRGWLWEVEAAHQFGQVGLQNQDASAFTLGLGHALPWLPCWSPSLWVYYDWAEGGDPASGSVPGTGYHQQFPLAHKYLGFMDLFGRRNIEDLNFKLVAKPKDNLKLLAWYHIFNLQDTNDVPYNVVLGPSATTPGGDSDLGQELDLVAIWNFHQRQNLVLGYSRFFAGDFYSTNPSATFAGDANFYFVQYTLDF